MILVDFAIIFGFSPPFRTLIEHGDFKLIYNILPFSFSALKRHNTVP